jgi:3-hydroxy-9,10-secoandrosta-1,3,5(10)-triene-9,17-dione monooxygenase reductase component
MEFKHSALVGGRRLGGVTIHSEHPFETPPAARDVVRQLRGRLASGVTVWTAASEGLCVGLTVSSMLVAEGDASRVLGLLDPESDLYGMAVSEGRVAISVLGGQHRYLADAFAGVAPAPGGMFRLGEWQDTSYGPVLVRAVATIRARLVDSEPRELGWSRLVEAVIEEAEIGETNDLLIRHRGRYHVL